MSQNQLNPNSLKDEFAKALKLQDKAERTVKTYVNAVSSLVHFHNSINPLAVTVNHLRSFLFYLKEEKGYAARTYNQFLYGLKAFYEIFLPDVPLMQSFRRMKTKACNIIIITRFEFEAMVRHTTNLKHRALLEILYGTGVRVKECSTLTFSDIDRPQKLLRVMGKGDKQRFTILPDRVLKTLEDYYRSYKPKQYLFEGRDNKPLTTTMIEHAVRQAGAKADIKKKLHLIFYATALLLISWKQMGGLMFSNSY